MTNGLIPTQSESDGGDEMLEALPIDSEDLTYPSDKSPRRIRWFWLTASIVFTIISIATYKLYIIGKAQGKELSPEEIFKAASPAVVRIDVRDRESKLIGQGSGFLISEDGLIATNCHVIEGADSAQVVFPDNSKYTVEGVATYVNAVDLAVLKIPGSQFPVLALADDDLPDIGSKVYAIGNPRGLTNTLSDGLVSGLRLVSDEFSLIQTSTPISSGSSGGPLLSCNGKVLGLTTAIIQGGQNLNLAVPVRALKDAITKRGELQHLASVGAATLKAKNAQRLEEVWAAIHKKDFTHASQLTSQLKDAQKDSAHYWFAVAFIQSEVGEQQQALDAWQTSLKIDPNNSTAFFNLGCACQALERTTEAIAAYNSALALNPKFVSALNNRGVAYVSLKDYHKALESYKAAVEIDPGHAKAHAGMGLAYLNLHQFDSAVQSLRTAISFDLNDSASYSLLGRSHFGLKDYGEALIALRAALHLNPNDVSAHVCMGRCHGCLANYNFAAQAFESALRINPKRADAHYYLGLTYNRTQETAKATEHWQQAARLDPNGQTGKEAQKRLDFRVSGTTGGNVAQVHNSWNATPTIVHPTVYPSLYVPQVPAHQSTTAHTPVHSLPFATGRRR
jgi:tetratricopeptide (TPR) repeat protein